jgi:hypothetical protein
MPKTIDVETSTDTPEEVAEAIKHYGFELEAPASETTEDKPVDETDVPKTETPAPDATSDEAVKPPAEPKEEKGKTDAVTETAKPQEQVVTEEPHREDFDNEEKFSEALEDWKDKQKPKGDGGFQRRIDKLTKKLRSAEAKLEKEKQKPEAKSTPVDASKPVAEPAKPEATPKPKVEDFGTYEEYGEAMADWKISQRLGGKSIDQLVKEQVDEKVAKEVDVKVQKVLDDQARQEVITAYTERQDEARKAHEDWDEVVNSDDITINGLMGDIMLRSEMGPEMAYFFGKNPDEAQRLNDLKDPIALGIEMGKVEATLVHEAKAAKRAAETKPAKTETPAPVIPRKPKVSAAPEPIEPVNSKTATPGFDPAKSDDIRAYNAWRNSGGGS